MAEALGRPCRRCGADQWMRTSNRGAPSWRCWECHRQRKQDSYRRNLPRQLWLSAKKRAERDGTPFSILPEHIAVPSHCPALGLPLSVSHTGSGGTDYSPTLDRIIPELGYVPGNVAVISGRANRAKNDLTCVELEALLDYVRRNTRPTDAS